MSSKLRNQLSAFFFKTFIIAQRKKGSHLGLLVFLQSFVLLLFFQIGQNSMPANESSNNSPSRTPEVEEKMYFPVANGFFNFSNGKLVVICEDKSPDNLKLKQAIERLAGPNLFQNDDFTSGVDFDNWYLDIKKSYSNEEGPVRQNPEPPRDIKPDDVEYVFLIKPMIVDPKGKSSFNIDIQTNVENAAHPFNFLNRVFAEMGVGGSINNYRVPIIFERYTNFKDKERHIATYSLALLSSLCILVTSGLFVSLCIGEKEDKILMLMRLNGLSFFGYFSSQWICFMILQSVAFGIALATFFMNPYLVYSNSSLLIVPLYLCLMSQTVIFSIIVSMFFKRAMVASTFCIMAVLFGLNTFGSFGFIYNLWQFSFLPLFGCSITAGRLVASVSGRSFIEVLFLKEIWTGLLAAFLWNFPMYFLCSYLYNVKEQGYSGTLKPWHYPITDLIRSRKEEALVKASNEKVSDESIALMDSDVRKMAEVINGDYDQVVKAHSLVYRNVKKIYASGNLVVDDVSIALKGNQIFGLLGPNGAGKTTLMHITAGLYEASSGSVVLEGHDSRISRNEYLSKIGFCPQHDIYWKFLTVSEHLRFFEILRGTNPKEIDDRVVKTLDAVRLNSYAGTLASKISGGERRRMSLAMALSGDSKVVLLDEPTTGLDPKVRRMVWDIISESRHGRLVILTTHSMEEAELLSETITIMAHGRLKCLGSPNHLKQKFGGQIFVNVDHEHGRFQDAVRGIRECCPEGTEVTIVSEGLGSVFGRLRFSGDKKQALSLMRNLLSKKANYGITSFGIIQSSLDDVFMNIVRSSDADA